MNGTQKKKPILMGTDKFRIAFTICNSFGDITEYIDFTDFSEFANYLKDNGIKLFSLSYQSRVDDSFGSYKYDITPDSCTQEHFDWLAEKDGGNPRFLKVNRQVKPPVVPTSTISKSKVMHEDLMPFEPEKLKKYFAKESAEKHVQYFQSSIEKYQAYKENTQQYKDGNYKEFRQAEKDERFFTTRYFVALFEHKDKIDKLKSLLVKAFGDIPPFEKDKSNPLNWDDLLSNLELTLEKDLPAPIQYKAHLSKSLHKRHFVPYVLEHGTKADKSYRIDLEGATQVDAFIGKKDGLHVIIEAKYLSDISCNVSYDVARNQIARNIDVMLDCDKDRSLFLLLTPKYFKDQPHTRLYGYKMNDYLANHLNLMADLCHRSDIEPYEWKRITERIAWITWEDLDSLGLKSKNL